MQRRSFLASIAAGGGAAAVTTRFGSSALVQVEAAARRVAGRVPRDVAGDESFWRDVQQAFSVNRSIVNLDNANVCPSPRTVTEAMIRYTWELEEAPAIMLWEVLLPQLATARAGLARLFGCDAEEVALVRNTTEALDAVLLGIDLRAGDEILTTTHDYWAMHDAIDQRVAREGVVKKVVDVPVPVESLDRLVELFERAMTPKTRLLLVSHPVNLTGQLFPVKAICEMAHRRGAEVVVDGAHVFGHVDFKVQDLGCDYFGTSLHKWLLAPLGTGMLYIRKDKIAKVWPLVPTTTPYWPGPPGSMFKFEDVGTRSIAMALAVTEALAFHTAIGPKVKEERLRYLRSYWADRLERSVGARFLASFAPEMSCGLATFRIEHVDPKKLTAHLWDRHRILVQRMTSPRVPMLDGIRVTPNLYTTLDELDAFCDAVERAVRDGMSATA
jgi:selenocysteine lyase/cysteine desulfurase